MIRQNTCRNTGFTRTEFLVILAIISGLFALLYPALQGVRNPKGPYGKKYPSDAPDEVNRVTHPTGLSIILPENWDDLSNGGICLRIAARGAPGRRLKSVIAIMQCDPKPDPQTLARCKEIQFQNFPPYEICRVERKSSFDDPASSS